ncbi:family 20 glycosylhydrolase [Lacticaseibacillus suilingensis]|jgi:hexosaminidase|uniref:Family 20 glycosylhydrolase n=1 Tax=Lacticaseibacillus suilingensis TaxID=2799577 RepID=A0ABW4BJA6_9LACO|nr:family 20 glycosylhydrolase [Lacticaseibacillus suilingensis]
MKQNWHYLLYSTLILTGLSLGYAPAHQAHAAVDEPAVAQTQTASTDSTSSEAKTNTTTDDETDSASDQKAAPNANQQPVADTQTQVLKAAVTTPTPTGDENEGTLDAKDTETPAKAEPTTVANVQIGEDIADTQQVAVTNVKDYKVTSTQAIDWSQYHYVAAPELDKASPLGYQVDKFATNYQAASGTELSVLSQGQKVSQGVISINTADQTVTNDQGYRINITADNIAISASSQVGAFYALTTLTQLLQAKTALPLGVIEDAPEVSLREVSVDCGRKYYSKAWFMNLIDEMAASKANDLLMHFSDKTGFMLESKSHPEVMSSQYLTQDEVKEIIAYAKQNFITVTPEFDMPGHLGQVLSQHPEFQLPVQQVVSGLRGGKMVTIPIGKPLKNSAYLDITNPDAVAFMKSLLDEYMGLFGDSSPYFSIGADEYLGDDWTAAGMAQYPALVKAAQAKYGADATGVEAFYDFLNEMGDYVKAHGYQVEIFHDRIERRDATSKVALNKDFIVKYWTHCRTNMPTLQTMIDDGYKLINFDDGYLYYVLGQNAGYKYPKADNIYNGWDNGVFANVAGDGKIDGKEIVQKLDHSQLSDQFLGSAISIWSDNHDAQTEDEVAAQFAAPLRAFAQKAWGIDDAIDYTTFAAVSDNLPLALVDDEAMSTVVWNPELPADPEPETEQNVESQPSTEPTNAIGDAGKQPVKAVALTHQDQKTKAATLPATGETQNSALTFLGTALVALLGLFGFRKHRA